MLKRVAAETLVSASQAPASAKDESAVPATQPVAMPIERGSRAFAEVLASWQQLSRGAPPMFSPEFLLLTARLAGDPEAILVGASGASGANQLVAALALARCGRKLVSLLSDHTPRVDIVGRGGAMPQLWRAVRDLGGWDELELERVPGDSPLATKLPRLARGDGYRAVVRETHRVPWFPVDGIEQRIHRRFRGDMRRLERQLGGVELERVSAFDRGALRDFCRIEALAWKGAEKTAIDCDARIVRFYSALARVFARRGGLTIAFLRARGVRIASCFALEDATTFYLFKIGYDPEYAHYGPGQLLVRETAADATRRGLQRYDMLGKAAPWKLKWSDQSLAHSAVTIYAPSVRGCARHFAREVARPLAGKALRTLCDGRGHVTR